MASLMHMLHVCGVLRASGPVLGSTRKVLALLVKEEKRIEGEETLMPAVI